MYVNVTVCAPGSTTNCQTIDHVQVDTGSQGLRIISSVLNSSLLSALHPVSPGGRRALAECTQFVDGYSWGPLVYGRCACRRLGYGHHGRIRAGIFRCRLSAPPPIRFRRTARHGRQSTPENTVAEFGANGIIGVGLFDEDCGADCAVEGLTNNGNPYYSCTSSGCSADRSFPWRASGQSGVHAGGKQRRDRQQWRHHRIAGGGCRAARRP